MLVWAHVVINQKFTSIVGPVAEFVCCLSVVLILVLDSLEENVMEIIKRSHGLGFMFQWRHAEK